MMELNKDLSAFISAKYLGIQISTKTNVEANNPPEVLGLNMASSLEGTPQSYISGIPDKVSMVRLWIFLNTMSIDDGKKVA